MNESLELVERAIRENERERCIGVLLGMREEAVAKEIKSAGVSPVIGLQCSFTVMAIDEAIRRMESTT